MAAIILLSGCTGAIARKSPEELARTPDIELCDQYLMVTGNMYMSGMDMGREELQVIYAEFLRRGIPPEKVTFHCAHQTNP